MCDVLAAALMLLHTTLVPAGGGAVVGLVWASRASTTTEPAPTADGDRVLWRLAVVATAASGVVHAVAVPHHAEENLLFGVFFFLSASVQFLWCTLAVLAPTRSLLRWGAVVDVVLIALWALTRTVGLPGLLEGPEAVGSWDLAAKLWEVVALLCSAALLHRTGTALPDDSRNHRHGRSWLVYSFVSVSAAALVVLSLSGPPA